MIALLEVVEAAIKEMTGMNKAYRRFPHIPHQKLGKNFSYKGLVDS